MKNYFRERIRADAERAVLAAAGDADLVHKPTRGRFRELAVSNLLSPWLPSDVRCGTGVIVDTEDRPRKSTQDDIILYDTSLAPSFLASSQSEEGVFPVDCVLVRIEVKSRLTLAEMKKSINAALEIDNMMAYKAHPQKGVGAKWVPVLSYLFAFKTDLHKWSENGELIRFIKAAKEAEQISGPFSHPPLHGLCVVGEGCWIYSSRTEGALPHWYRAECNLPLNEVIFFVGVISNTCFGLHIQRQGRRITDTTECGIGAYVLDGLGTAAFPEAIFQ